MSKRHSLTNRISENNLPVQDIETIVATVPHMTFQHYEDKGNPHPPPLPHNALLPLSPKFGSCLPLRPAIF